MDTFIVCLYSYIVYRHILACGDAVSNHGELIIIGALFYCKSIYRDSADVLDLRRHASRGSMKGPCRQK